MSETKKDSVAPLSDVSGCSTFTNLLASVLSTPIKKRHLEDNNEDEQSPKRQKTEHSPSPTLPASVNNVAEDALNRSASTNAVNGSEPDEELFSSAKKLLDTSIGFDNESARQDDSDDLFSKVNRADNFDGSKVTNTVRANGALDLMDTDEPMTTNDYEPVFTSARLVKELEEEPMFTSTKKLLKANKNTEAQFTTAKEVAQNGTDEPMFASAKSRMNEETESDEPVFTSAKKLVQNSVPTNTSRRRVKIGDKPLKGKKVNISDLFEDDDATTGPEEPIGEFATRALTGPFFKTAKSSTKGNEEAGFSSARQLLQEENEASNATNDEPLFTSAKQLLREENDYKPPAKAASAQKRVVIKGPPLKKAKINAIFDDEDDQSTAVSTEFSFGQKKSDANEPKDEVDRAESKKESDEDLLAKYGGFTNFATGKSTTNILKDKKNITKAQQVLGDEKKAALSRIFDDEDDKPEEGAKKESDEDLLEKYGGFTNFATGKSTTNLLKNKGNMAKAQKVLGDDPEKKARLGRIFDDEEGDEPESTKKESDEDLLEKYGGFTNFATGKSTTNILKNKTSLPAAHKVLGDNSEKKARLSRIFDDDDNEENKPEDEPNKESDEALLEKYGGFTNFATGKSETNILKKKDSLNAAQKMLNTDEKKSRLSRIFDDDDDEDGLPQDNDEDLLAKFGGFQNMATKQPMKPPANKESVSRVNAIFDEKDDDEEALEKAFAKRREQVAKQRVQKRQPAPAPLNPLEKGKKPFVKPRATVTPSKPPVARPVPDVPLASSQDDQISQSDIDLLAGLEDFTQVTQDKDSSEKMVLDKPEAEEITNITMIGNNDNINNDNVNNEGDQTNNNNTNVNNVNTNREEHVDSQTARQIQETLEGIDFDKEFADLEPKQENNEPKEETPEQSTSNSPSPNKNFFYTVSTNQAPKTPTAKAPNVLYSTPTAGNKKFSTPPTPQSTPGTVHRRFLTPSNSMFKQKSNFSTPSTVKRKGIEGTPTNTANGLLSPNVNKQLMFSPNKATPKKAINYGVGETPKKSGGTSPSRPNKEIALFNLTKPANRYSLKDFSVKYLRRPEHLSEDTLRAYNIDPAVMNMTADSAAQFKFQNPENPGELIGYNELRSLLIGDGAVEKLATVAWVKNHYKWIVWKLASMERMFPQDYANQYLTAARVLSQLKYRYEREINQAQRPALKKILERDEFAGRYMVLCVSAIRYRGKDGVFVPAKPIRDKSAGNPFPPMRQPSDPAQKEEVNENANEEDADYEALGGNCAIIEVTDGWYSVNAHLDEYMTALVRRGKIFVGLKLRVFGATISGSDQGASPLEITPSTMLKLRINGVRRAKWHAKLGLQRSRDFVVNLKSIRSLGGPIPSISVLIERVYPMLFMESYPMRENSFKVTRTEPGEWRAKKVHEDMSRTILDKKFNELVKEQENDRKAFLDHLNSNFGKRKYSRQEIYEVDDKEELYYLFRKEHESPEFLQLLSHQQHNELMRFIDELNATDREEVDKQLAKYKAEHPDLNRTVTPFVRVQVRDHPSLTHSPQKISRGYLTIWNPHPEMFSTVREGYHVTISMANPSESRDATALMTEGEITYMTANKMTRYNLVSRAPTPSFKARECTHFDSFGKLVGSKEFDMVGVVIGTDQKQEAYEFNKVLACQNIYLTDTTGVILVVQIRCSPDDFPNRDTVSVGNIVGMANLSYRFYDERCGVHMSSTSIYTAYYSKSIVSPYMQSTRDTIDQWMKQDVGKETIAQLKEKIEELRDMNAGRNNNNGQMYYSQVNQHTTTENTEQVNDNETEGQQKSYLDDDLDEILAKIDV